MTRSDGAATLSDVLERTARILREAGIEDAAAEARWLVCEATGVRPIDLLVRADVAIDGSEAERIAAFAARRANSEPLSRILGKREFYGRDFQLSPATLDPRADTETLVDLALQVAQEPARKGRPLRLLDVGTGTGAILVSLLAELPAATGLGIDVSADAVATSSSISTVALTA